MNTDQRLFAIGAFICSALYLTGTFVAGLFFSGAAWKCSLAAAGVAFLSYSLQASMLYTRGSVTDRITIMFSLLSNVLGIIAGTLLIMVT